MDASLLVEVQSHLQFLDHKSIGIVPIGLVLEGPGECDVRSEHGRIVHDVSVGVLLHDLVDHPCVTGHVQLGDLGINLGVCELQEFVDHFDVVVLGDHPIIRDEFDVLPESHLRYGGVYDVDDVAPVE